MKYYSEKSIPARLIQAEEAIVNGQSNEVSSVLVGQGYTPEEFSQGTLHIEVVRTIDADRREHLGAQVVATASVKEAFRVLRRSFSADRKLMRQALAGNDEYITALRLHERMNKQLEAFVLQARHLYEKVVAHEGVMALLQSRYNMTAELLNSRFEEIVELEAAIQQQQYLKGQLREAAKQHREAMATLDKWMRRFIAVARIAFDEDKPKLEKLGIHVRSKN
ncbi:MAG: hypothetical protein KTR29_17090 [Rhodothermaceae bacterium]|nr:hypothetical protein [Rhodothermaceae bacterium]